MDCDFEFRSIDETGHFTGYASVYGVKDSYDSIFDVGSLTPEKLPLPLTYQHDFNQVIGGVSVFENRSDGAYVEGDFDLNVARAKEVYSLAKKNIIRGLSHRFSGSVNEYKDGVRHITSAKVSEIAFTPQPSNKKAGTTSVRSQDEEFYDDYSYPLDDSRAVPPGDDETRDVDTSSSWDAGAARAAIKKWATGADGKVDTGKYGQAFLVKGGDKLSDYKFPIKTVKNGKLVVVCAAVHAAEGRLKDSNVGNKSGIAATLEGLAKKCGFRDNKKTDDGGRSAEPTPDEEVAAPAPEPEPDDQADFEANIGSENAEKMLQDIDERLQELDKIKDSLTGRI
jgi:HK97 family phage prohead protease